MKDTSNWIKYTILMSLDCTVKVLQQKPLSFKQRSVLPGIRLLKHCLRECIQKSQTGPCSDPKSQKIIIIQGYRTYACPLLESETHMNEQRILKTGCSICILFQKFRLSQNRK
jgi:hypothetical protein